MLINIDARGAPPTAKPPTPPQTGKYGLGGCIDTKRIAYLNTNALQQLHTYFFSTLPRPYDRGLISNTFMIDRTILEKTLEFVLGE